MRSFPPAKAIDPRKDRPYLNHTTMLLCSLRNEDATKSYKRHSLRQRGMIPGGKRGRKKRQSREAGDAYGTRRWQVKYHSQEHRESSPVRETFLFRVC